MTNVTKCIWSALLLKWYSINNKKIIIIFNFILLCQCFTFFYLLIRILDRPLWLKSKKMFVLGNIETVLSVTCFFFFVVVVFVFVFFLWWDSGDGVQARLCHCHKNCVCLHMIPFQKVWGTHANATHARFCKIALNAQTSYYKYSFFVCV